MSQILDSCVLIDHLRGVPEATACLMACDDPAITRITWMEVLVGAAGRDEERPLRALLSTFEIVELDAAIAEEAVQLRRRHRLKVPDAIQLASASVTGSLLMTADAKDFPSSHPSVRIAYRPSSAPSESSRGS